MFRWIGEGVAEMLDLHESTGRNKRDAGELSFRVVRKDGLPRLAARGAGGWWYWLSGGER